MKTLLPLFVLLGPPSWNPQPQPAGEFRPVPVSTPDQQEAMNRFGNLAVADMIEDRCARAFDPPITMEDRTAIAAQYDLAEQSATLALKSAFPLEKPDHFAPYLAAYRQHEIDLATKAIDARGCADPGIVRMIDLIHDLQQELARLRPAP